MQHTFKCSIRFLHNRALDSSDSMASTA